MVKKGKGNEKVKGKRKKGEERERETERKIAKMLSFSVHLSIYKHGNGSERKYIFSKEFNSSPGIMC